MQSRIDNLVTRISNQWLPLALVASCFGIVVLIGSGPISNPDTYFHLVVGQRFLDDWTLRNPGTLTPFASADWLPTQWLPEIAMAKAYQWFGLGGVAVLSGLQLTVLATTLIYQGRKVADLRLVAPLSMVALLASASGLSMRPQVISYILAVVVASTWLRYPSTGRAPWWIIPMTWVWAMCHGMWPFSAVISAAAVIGIALDRRDSAAQLVRLALIPVASLAAGLVTPVGPNLIGAVLKVNSRRSYFQEWSPPDATTIPVAAALFILAVALVAMWRGATNSWLSISIATFACGMGVYSSRTVPIAAGIGVLLACAALQDHLGDRQPISRRDMLPLVVFPLVAVTTIVGLVTATDRESTVQPASLERDLRALPDNTPIWTSMEYGGFVLFSFSNLIPTTQGYADQYTDEELETLVTIGRGQPGWSQKFAKLDVNYALVHPYDILAYNLRTFMGWTPIYADDDVTLLRAPQ